jgi:hypothetical protein
LTATIVPPSRQTRSKSVARSRGEEFAPVGRFGLELPEAAEVGEHFIDLVEARVARRSGALKFFLERLAADVFLHY